MATHKGDTVSLLRAVGKQVRAASPDVAFAGHFIIRDRRLAVYTVASVLRVLHEVMSHCKSEGNSCDAEGCTAASGGPCAGESPDQKRAVCQAIIEFLASGQKTGKADLDGFSGVATRFGVARRDLESFADGLAIRLTTRRCATWTRLRRDRLAIAGGAAGALAAVMGAQPGRQVDETTLKHLTDGALTVVLCHDLYNLAEHWRAGRLTVALEDLTAAGLSEADLRRFAQARSVAADERWGKLMARLGQRIGALHEQAERGLASLEPSRQRAYALWALVQRDRFNQWLAAGGDPFSAGKEPAGSTWRRLTRVPAALRVLRKAQSDFQARMTKHE